MAVEKGLGSFINGSFVKGSEFTITSKNPAKDFVDVFVTWSDQNHVDQAVCAAREAYENWSSRSQDYRNQQLLKLKDAFIKNQESIARAISLEMGKIYSESLIEAQSLSARIDLMINHGAKKIADEKFYNLRAKTTYHPQGVLAVIGPFNFPAHLVNAHVIPSLMAGNTVVVKPSEICPKVAELYAQCFREAQFDAGVFNMVQGTKNISSALCTHENIDGVLFTGSYKTGRILQEALLDQPHKILALELGGKNFSIIMDDADLNQALAQTFQAAFLTGGQRCTATSRILVHKNLFDQFKSAFVKLCQDIKVGDPFDSESYYGPLANDHSLDRYFSLLEAGKNEGAKVLLESKKIDGGAFVTPSLYEVKHSHPVKNYLGEELFGPNVAIESFDTLDQAIGRVNQSPYGLSNSIFSLDQSNFHKVLNKTKSGLLNFNRSTNGASGQLPFGGVNKSGNQRPAGIDAVKYATYPVAVTELAYGALATDDKVKSSLEKINCDHVPVKILSQRHRVEKIFEMFGIHCDMAARNKIIFNKNSFSALNGEQENFFRELKNNFSDQFLIDNAHVNFFAQKISDEKIFFEKLISFLNFYAQSCGLNLHRNKNQKINVPDNLFLFRSRRMLDRLYKNNFVPAEKKDPVVDITASTGPYLKSVDDEPLILFDAASQIATMGAGFMADTFQLAYDEGHLDHALLKNVDLSKEIFDQDDEFAKDAIDAKKSFEKFLHEKSHNQFKRIAYGAGGAEANELAFDFCRQTGQKGTKIIAFEGAFHGRTIMALQSTFNKQKRGPFLFEGYEAEFVPFPECKDPDHQPEINQEFLKEFYAGIIPQASNLDTLHEKEIDSLRQLKVAIDQGNICCVIIEPMQCEGGDRYATNRFFNYLRGLTRGLKIPLVFDEVQTGFNLGRQFFWYEQFNLKNPQGQIESPDCLTLGKKSQLGICLSQLENNRSYTPHVLQLKRGLLHGQALCQLNAKASETIARKKLSWLHEAFPKLVLNPRAYGFAFAFDMPSNAIAMTLINQRFARGFMAYIAGEKTIRFRLNMTCNEKIIGELFENIFAALIDIKHGQTTSKTSSVNLLREEKQKKTSNIVIETFTAESFDQYQKEIDRIECEAYEPGRRDSMETLKMWATCGGGLGLKVTCDFEGKNILAGYAFGGPMEKCDADGLKHDGLYGKNVCFYSADITLDKSLHGLGLGQILKQEQIKLVSRIKNSDGQLRYNFMCGRNRMGHASTMTGINKNFGAYTVSVHDNQYGNEKAKAIYYRIPINKTRHLPVNVKQSESLNCQNSIDNLFKETNPEILHNIENNFFRPYVGSKLTLSNWATPNVVRYSELLRELMPKHLQHCYFTSGRDEVVDKGLRSLRFHRPGADKAISFSHQWFGNVSAAARSLSFDQGQQKPFSFFDWPKISHPQIVGEEKSLQELKACLKNYKYEKVLGIVVELMGEKSGFCFSEQFLQELDLIRNQTGIPLVFSENASGYFRNGQNLFHSDSLSVKANMVWWFSGGQLGHIFVDDNYFVEKPLTLISTWDGDDVSILRAYHNMLRAKNLGEEGVIEAVENMILNILPNRIRFGKGAWFSFQCENESTREKYLKLAQDKKVFLGKGFDNMLMVCPNLDLGKTDLKNLSQALTTILSS